LLSALAAGAALSPSGNAGEDSKPSTEIPPSQALVLPRKAPPAPSTSLIRVNQKLPAQDDLRSTLEARYGPLSDEEFHRIRESLRQQLNERYGVMLTDAQFGSIHASLLGKLLQPALDIDDKEGVMFLVEIRESTPDAYTAYWDYTFARDDLQKAGFRVHSKQFFYDPKAKKKASMKVGEGIALAQGSARDIVRTIAALHTGTSGDLGPNYSMFLNAKKVPFESEPGSVAELLWQEKWNIALDLGKRCVWSVLRAARVAELVQAVQESGLKLPAPPWKRPPLLPEPPSSPPQLPPPSQSHSDSSSSIAPTFVSI
jgi:hypothetical protein